MRGSLRSLFAPDIEVQFLNFNLTRRPTAFAKTMSTMGFKIRRASKQDFESAYDLVGHLGYPNLNRELFKRVYESVLDHPDMIVLVAESDSGNIIGLESISLRPQIRLAGLLATIDELVVAETARGQGIGRALLNEAKAVTKRIAEENQLSLRLQLETNRSRESYLREFYVKNGFKEADSAIMRFAG